jgi:hypothetical protein
MEFVKRSVFAKLMTGGGHMNFFLPGVGWQAARNFLAIIAAALLASLAPASAFQGPGPAQLRADKARTGNTLLHKIIVVCRVYNTGNVRHTEYCDDGYTCGPGDKCLPGPEILRQQEAKRQAQRQAAAQQGYKTSATRRSEESRLVSRTTSSTTTTTTTTATSVASANIQSGNCALSGANGYACTYYNWDGDPKEIPTPRYRSGGGASQIGHAARAQNIAKPMQQKGVPVNIAGPLSDLIARWQELAANDPARPAIENQANQIIQNNKLPLNAADYFGKAKKCSLPNFQLQGMTTPLKLQWTPLDLPKRALDTQVCQPGDGLQDCVDAHYGQLVMGVEPGIRALCQTQEVNTPADKFAAAVNTCAQRKFDGAWNSLANGGITSQSAADLDPVNACSEEARQRYDKIAGLLKKLVKHPPKDNDKGQPDPDPKPDAKPDQKDDQIIDVGDKLENEQSQPDDVLCTYLARWSVRGKLVGGGIPELPNECKPAINVAKDCEKENCQMAKVIDNEDRKKDNATNQWGADDREAIQKILDGWK